MQPAAQAWLAVQCKLVGGVRQGVVVLASGQGERPQAAQVAARWPAAAQGSPALHQALRTALAQRRGVLPTREYDPLSPDAAPDLIAVPFLVAGRLCGGVAVEVAGRPAPQRRAVLETLRQGCVWLELLLEQHKSGGQDGLVTVLELVAVALEHERFEGAATAVVTELATRLACERVSLGFVARSGRVRIRALSHSTRLGRTNLLRDLEAAMREAVDQDASVAHPPPPGRPPRVDTAHEELCRRHGAGAACSVPLAHEGRIVAALTLERPAGDELDPRTLELCEQAGALLGPLLALRHREDRWLAAKIWDALRDGLARLAGPDRRLTTALAALLVVGGIFLAAGPAEHRITARATLEGSVQRAVVAAIEGYVAEAHARAGDVVRAGDVLATLDGRDLELERLKWSGEREQLAREHRGALAAGDRARTTILDARIAQAAAEVALLDEQLARTVLTAPFDGVVVKGDLSQALGSPVERGEVLFEVAPLEGYRVILQVDERDVDGVVPGRRGRLALAARPDERLALVVETVTPVASAQEGRNVFRVEARLEEPSALLRPGMEGVARVEIGQRRRLWIWTHRLVDWVRLWTWSWWP